MTEYIIVAHACFECGTESEVTISATCRVVTCPICNTQNDMWLENELPPENHINDPDVLIW